MKGDPKKEVELQQMLFNNLTHLHLRNAQIFKPEMTYDELYKEIKHSYITHHVSRHHATPNGKKPISNIIGFRLAQP